jgi:putative SOS response-associated peptidase YedK
MPVLLSPAHWPAWLGETAANEAELKALLRPYPGAGMDFWPVDRRVGNVKNDDPDLFAPVAKPA